MGRLEKQLDPHTGPLARLACDLRELRRLAGSPTYRAMSSVAKYSPSALSAAASGAALPSEGVLAAYVAACGGDVPEWQRRRAAVAEALSHQGSLVPPPEPRPVPRVSAVPERPAAPRQRFVRHRAAGLVAAMILGSMATVVPMAIWGAPACLSGGQPVPATSCPAGTAR